MVPYTSAMLASSPAARRANSRSPAARPISTAAGSTRAPRKGERENRARGGAAEATPRRERRHSAGQRQRHGFIQHWKGFSRPVLPSQAQALEGDPQRLKVRDAEAFADFQRTARLLMA